MQKVSKRAVQGTRIQLLFTNEGTARKLTEAIEDNLLRICEEAVTNAVKHARPTQVEVNLEYMPEELRLRIRDDGCGFDQQGLDHIKNGHLGLVGIRERTKTLGGKLSLRSQPGMGTEVLVSVPQGE